MRWFGPKLKPVREIRSQEGDLHFQRWQLLALPWGTLYLHHIARADEDKHLHNHPWDFTSLILKGGYVEIRRNHKGDEVGKAMTPGSMAHRTVDDYHKVEKLLDDTWTLFWTGPRTNPVWGYWTDEEGFIDHEDYRARKHEGTLP